MAERKKYIEVEIPIIDSKIRVLGTPKELDKKTIKLDLTRKLRGKGLCITFQIFNIKEKLIAIPKKLEIMKSHIQRSMRKRVDYVEDSFITKCADIRAIIKPFLITRKRVSRAVRKNLRNTAKEFLTEYLKERDYYTLCEEIISGTLQKALLPKLKKVYPLSFCELRVFETKEIEKIDTEKIKVVEEKEVKKEQPEPAIEKEETDKEEKKEEKGEKEKDD